MRRDNVVFGTFPYRATMATHIHKACILARVGEFMNGRSLVGDRSSRSRYRSRNGRASGSPSALKYHALAGGSMNRVTRVYESPRRDTMGAKSHSNQAKPSDVFMGIEEDAVGVSVRQSVAVSATVRETETAFESRRGGCCCCVATFIHDDISRA